MHVVNDILHGHKHEFSALLLWNKNLIFEHKVMLQTSSNL